MPRNERPIRLSASARDALSQKIEEKLALEQRAQDVRSIQGLVDRYGRKEFERRYAKVAGIKEASARDAITRFLSGKRAPSAKSLSKLDGAQRSIQVSRTIREGRTTPAIVGTFRVSKTEWHGRAAPRAFDANARVRLADAIEAGDMEGVADVVLGAYGKDFRNNLSSVDGIEDFEL